MSCVYDLGMSCVHDGSCAAFCRWGHAPWAPPARLQVVALVAPAPRYHLLCSLHRKTPDHVRSGHILQVSYVACLQNCRRPLHSRVASVPTGEGPAVRPSVATCLSHVRLPRLSTHERCRVTVSRPCMCCRRRGRHVQLHSNQKITTQPASVIGTLATRRSYPRSNFSGCDIPVPACGSSRRHGRAMDARAIRYELLQVTA